MLAKMATFRHPYMEIGLGMDIRSLLRAGRSALMNVVARGSLPHLVRGLALIHIRAQHGRANYILKEIEVRML